MIASYRAFAASNNSTSNNLVDRRSQQRGLGCSPHNAVAAQRIHKPVGTNKEMPTRMTHPAFPTVFLKS